MGHDKLRKFAENENFLCLLQPSAEEVLSDGYFNLKDHEIKGHWDRFFAEMGYSGDPGLVVELGCGKGEYTVALAEKDPSSCYVGVDIKGARLWKGAGYVTRQGIVNAAFLRTRIEFITAYFAPSEVSGIWLTFSDPQVRKENARLTSPLFLERYRKFLKPGGVVHLKTDSQFLYQYTLTVCKENGLEILALTDDLYASEDTAFSDARMTQTFYERMFLDQGYPIRYLAFRIDHDGLYVPPSSFDPDYWRSIEGDRQLFGRDTAETRRQKLSRTAPTLE